VKTFEKLTKKSLGSTTKHVNFFNRPKFLKGKKEKPPLDKIAGNDFLQKGNPVSEELKRRFLLDPKYEERLIGTVKSATNTLKSKIINTSLN
jgi:hypothetical protein